MTVNVSPLGAGNIISSDWNSNPESYPATYTCRMSYVITAIPAPGYIFARWEGAYESRNNPLSVSVRDGAKTVIAFFMPVNNTNSDGSTAPQGDCKDHDAAVSPAEAEICGDSKNNNCINAIDEGGSAEQGQSLIIPNGAIQWRFGWVDRGSRHDLHGHP